MTSIVPGANRSNVRPADPPGPYTRQQLIDICERAVVPMDRWNDRDSAEAQKGVGLAWAWLRAGCEYEFAASPKSDERTIWLTLAAEGFMAFEYGRDDRGHWDEELIYLPTPARLDAADGRDWY